MDQQKQQTIKHKSKKIEKLVKGKTVGNRKKQKTHTEKERKSKKNKFKVTVDKRKR